MRKSEITWLCLLFLALAVFFFAGCKPGTAGQGKTSAAASGDKSSIQIKGSDTIVNLVQMWAEEYAKLHPDANIGVTGGGSGTGFAALLNNTCDIAMASRAADAKEQNLAAKENLKLYDFVVGLDGLVVIVNPANPLTQLTLKELRAIFVGEIKNWSYFGGKDKKIVLLSRESNSGTHMFFKEHVLREGNSKRKDEFAPEALLMPSSQAIVNEVVQNPYCIGYVGLGYISPELRALRIAKSADTPYVAPTVENVMDNSYPISRPLFLYTSREPEGIMKNFIDYTLSPEGQQIVRKLDFVPIKKVDTGK